MRIIFFILFPLLTFGQIGINESAPNSSLDIHGYPEDPSKSSGLIAPRLTLSQLNNKLSLYTNETIGAIIYITTLDLTGPYVGSLKNIEDPGYYFYNGDYWEPFETKSGNLLLKASIPYNNGVTVQEFLQYRFNVIQLNQISIPTASWNASRYSFIVPISGVYLFLGNIQFEENENPSDVISRGTLFLAVNNINDQKDITQGIWKQVQSGNSTIPYSRLAYFEKGTEVVFYYGWFNSSSVLKIAGAELSINLLKIIEN